MTEIKKVAIIGAGTMGSSIAAALIAKNYPVLLKESSETFLAKGLTTIDSILKKGVEKGKVSPQDAITQRGLVTGTLDYANFFDIDLVIEAVPEQVEIKKSVLKDLNDHCKESAIIASNTSSMSISQLGSFSSRPAKTIGMHFFNPAHLMRLVEIIPGLETDQETIDTVIDFATKLGKLAVRVDECASFLVNRLLGRYMNESLWCLEEGIASQDEIDQKTCEYNMPVGPLALRDMNGADIGLWVAKYNQSEYGPRFEVPPLLESMVKANYLGKKTKKGFYIYDDQGAKIGPNSDLAQFVKPATSGDFKAERLFLPMINEAFLALQENVCRKEDLDKALCAGLGMRKGPLALANEMGLSLCLMLMEENFQKHGERYRPAPLLKRYVFAGRETID
ncbi:MAG: 3-hydroxyacyl-CoA dehydrogenase [Candidatus Melainabacteria bacterium]|nr:3-hydroxyacyl-CoA dehydrogenase [Candidatus Melainabacteria bacterium]